MEWAILEHLEPDERREVLRAAVRRKFRGGDTIFHQGDVGTSVHLIDKGHVAIRVVDRRGTSFTFEIMAPGSSFGEMSLVGASGERSASAVAIGAVETLSIGRDAWTDLQRRHPTVTSILVELLAERVRRLSEQLVDSHTLPAEERVVKQLCLLAASFERGAGTAVIPVTQEELASLAGSTRPTANRALQPLVAAGAIELARGRILVHDLDRLVDGRMPPSPTR